MNERLLIIVILVLIPMLNCLPSNSFYLIDLDQSLSSNNTYCSSLLTNEQLYRIPQQCHHHLLCDPYRCDDRSFRCIKIREALCCLHRHLESYCHEENSIKTKDSFRSVYFHMSIEHGYCEINLERIEKSDVNYCLANDEQITTTELMNTTPKLTRSTYKHFHRRLSTLRPIRNRHRLAARQNYSSLSNLDYLQQVTIIEPLPLSKGSIQFTNVFMMIMLIFSWLL